MRAMTVKYMKINLQVRLMFYVYDANMIISELLRFRNSGFSYFDIRNEFAECECNESFDVRNMMCIFLCEKRNRIV